MTVGPDSDSAPESAVPLMNVEAVLQATRALYPTDEVRILNWHRPKRDV